MGINLQKPQRDRKGRKPAIQNVTPKGPDWAVPAFAAVLAAVMLLSAGGVLGQPWAGHGRAVRQAIGQNATVRKMSPLSWYVQALHTAGIRPQEAKEPWTPSGVDYGNTRVPLAARPPQLTLAWQYRPKKLNAVPPGVNVLSPTWFYVEKDANGQAVVNDLNTLLEGKVNGWDPAQYIQTAHAGGAKVWASVVSFDPDLSWALVNDKEQQDAFYAKLSTFVSTLGLDGINFDFEKMDPKDKEKFTAFVARAKKDLPPGTVISVDVTVPLANENPNNWWQCYDRKGLGQVADYVCVMAYDNPALEPVAAIDWVADKMRIMLDQVPEDRILMGIPFFGVEYTFDVPEGETLKELPELTKSKTRRTATPAQVASLLAEGSYTSGGNKVQVQYWLNKGTWLPNKGMARYAFVDTENVLRVIYCDDAPSLELKGKLLTYNALAGAAVWRLEFGTEELWQSLSRGMAQR